MKPIALTKQIKKDRLFNCGDYNFFFDSENNLRVFPSHCPHLGYKLEGLSPVNNELTCPYHGYSFCANYGEFFNFFEYGGIIWQDSGIYNFDESFIPTSLISKLNADKWRSFKIKTNWRHLLSNLVDFSHFSVVHSSLGGRGLSKPRVEYIGKGLIDVIWESKFNRPAVSEVNLFLNCRGMVSRVPFFDTWLNNVSFVVEVDKENSVLLTNHWFEKEYYDQNPWVRFWTNRIVDLLVYEDKKILEKIPPNKPLLQKETNPLIKDIYYDN
jgi:phenylpropionate dioxygenase-like ring-hydroxylating dioxygenase large terminal subunit